MTQTTARNEERPILPASRSVGEEQKQSCLEPLRFQRFRLARPRSPHGRKYRGCQKPLLPQAAENLRRCTVSHGEQYGDQGLETH
jgi:hypothetical protein